MPRLLLLVVVATVLIACVQVVVDAEEIICSGTNAVVAQSKPDVGENLADRPAPKLLSSDGAAAVRCCSLDGQTCDSAFPSVGCGGDKVTLAQAETFCSDQGYRLCTLAEFYDKCIGSGCSYDRKFAWTSECSSSTTTDGATDGPTDGTETAAETEGTICSGTNAVVAQSKPDVGENLADRPAPKLLSSDGAAAVRCCSLDGQTCDSAFSSVGCGGDKVTLAQAETFCSDQGYRLCTLAEFYDKCIGSGCSYDRKFAWTSECSSTTTDGATDGPTDGTETAAETEGTICSGTNAVVAQSKPDVGENLADRPAPKLLSSDSAAAVRCCSLDGQTCDSDFPSVGCGGDNVTLAQAETFCSDQGYRLCTLAEFYANCKLSGCQYDRKFAWTSDCGCNADEGFYCDGQSIPCEAGSYCSGGSQPKVPCTVPEGYYCPAVWTPFTNDELDTTRRDSINPAEVGRRCPPNMYCAGNTTQPVARPLLCDLTQSCGPRLDANESCPLKQSTFFKYNDPKADVAVDGDESTCMKTATADTDENPQWLRVALGKERVVGTVRFSSSGAASDFEVLVTADDADPVDVQNGVERANPSQGGALPGLREACSVAAAGSGMFEASCGAGTKGAFVFVRRATAGTILQVCELEVYDHACVSEEEVSCPLGYAPSACTDEAALCRGCVPCPAGTYSDKVGPYECTVCPGHALYDEVPYSPEGSTSVFQCEGDAHLDGTSTLEVVPGGVIFNQTIDAWEILIDFEIARRIQINGLTTIFMSKGGDAAAAKAGTFQSKNFPCRADASRAAGSDVSARLSETVCCLQDMRQDYVMTKIFRDWTEEKDLVAANDVCDAEDGSAMLVNADLEVVGEGTVMVDTDGRSFAKAITVEPVPLSATEARRSHESYTGVQRAKITIPDAELYKISKSLNPDGSLADSRELFIGLLDLLPTGTRVVDSASQQISIVLSRTQYGTFAAYGEQNIDYDFISFLNARAHKVIDQSIDTRRSGPGDQYYAEVTFVYDDRLQPVNATGAVELDTVAVTIDDNQPLSPCDESLSGDFKDVVAEQTCGPQELAWTTEVCPQASIPDDFFGRLYIPLPDELTSDVIHIEFYLWFKDMGGRNDKIKLAMDLVVKDFVTWCDTDKGSVDLTEHVVPSMIIGTESSNPPRLRDFAEGEPFSTAAETLQDGLVTMVLEITPAEAKENLEIVFEDVLVVQVNPGSSPSAEDLKDKEEYIPTYKYYPDSRDASLILPEALNTSCPEATFSESFFGCVHKHVLKEEAITNKEWAYLVGSDPVPGTGAQDFMATMLGAGTAAVAARELGRDYEQYLIGAEEQIGTAAKIGLWLNPGHAWGQTVHNSEYSLSQHVIVYVLYGVKSGVDGTVTRRLLQATPSGNSMVTKTLKYEVTAATLVESVMEDVIAIEVEARLALSAEEACQPLASLRELCSERLEAAVAPHASKVERVECVSVQVENADCEGTRRAASAPVAVVDAVVALAKSEAAFLDVDAVVASGSVLAMTHAHGTTFPSAEGQVEEGSGKASSGSEGGSGSSTAIIGAAAGAAAGVVVVAFGAWKVYQQCKAPPEPLSEIVSTGVVAPASEKERIENLLFDHQRR